MGEKQIGINRKVLIMESILKTQKSALKALISVRTINVLFSLIMIFGMSFYEEIEIINLFLLIICFIFFFNNLFILFGLLLIRKDFENNDFESNVDDLKKALSNNIPDIIDQLKNNKN